jgi:hypothetical protein
VLAAVNPVLIYSIVAIVFAGWAIPVLVSELRRMRTRRRRHQESGRRYHRPGDRR